MGTFSLNNYNSSEGNYVSKILLPGTHKCRIIDLKLERPPYDKEQYNLIFVLEGEEVGDGFEGIQINKLDPSRGNYKGQIASVRSGQFGFKDWVYKGKTISRDESIQNYLGSFLKQLGLLEKFQGLNIQCDTIEDLVAAIKNFICKADFWLFFTIGGQKYYKDGSEYPNYSLYFPKRTEGKYAYALTAEDANFMPFNEAVHIYEKKVVEDNAEDVSGFSAFPPAQDIFNTPAETSAPSFDNNVSDLQLP
jgi:hypothetical protein